MILTVSAVYVLICILHGLIFLISRSLNTSQYTLASIIFTSAHVSNHAQQVHISGMMQFQMVGKVCY